MNYILMAIPGFFLLIAIELLFNKIKGTNYYRLNDAINSLAMGMLSRVSGVLWALIPFSLYVHFYEELALLSWESNLWTWILAFVLYDLSYYWNHRIGHVVNLGWASHVVHHSSEEYNLTTALRQTSIPNPIGALCYLPIALMGFPPWVLATVGSLNLLYQFWVHTQLIDRLPNWYEAIFVTPSNHRVHHAKNKIYVDKNFGGVFIIWDRMFGSFQDELKDEKVVFGISTQLASWNPIWGNVKVLSSLIRDAWHTQSWFDKFTLWFRRTGYRPNDVEARFPIEKSNLARDKYETRLNLGMSAYVIAQFVYIVSGIIAFMFFAKAASSGDVFIMASALAFALFSLGKVQESSPYAIVFEAVKFLSCCLTVFWLFSLTVAIAIASVSVIMFITLLVLQKQSQNTQLAET